MEELAYDVGHEREFYKYSDARRSITFHRVANFYCPGTISPPSSAWQMFTRTRTSRLRNERVHRLIGHSRLSHNSLPYA